MTSMTILIICDIFLYILYVCVCVSCGVGGFLPGGFDIVTVTVTVSSCGYKALFSWMTANDHSVTVPG